MNHTDTNSRDAVLRDGFELPSALREALAGASDAKPVRIQRQRGSAFATVTIASRERSERRLPIIATMGDGSASFGRYRSPVLTITAFDTDPAQLLAMLRNATEALERACEVRTKAA